MSDSPVDKGKARAPEVDERTPLLGESSSQDNHHHISSVETYRQSRNAPLNRPFLSLAIVALVGCFFTAFIFVVTSGYQYASWVAHVDPELLVKRGVIIEGPSNVELISVSSEAIVVRLDGAAGIDADWVMGLDNFSSPRRWFGRWLVERIDQITVSAGGVRVFAPYSRHQHKVPTDPLMALHIEPVTIPLTTRRHDFSGDSWLTPISVLLTLQPNADKSKLVDYFQDSLTMRRILARAEVDWVKVIGGNSRHWWKPWSLLEIKKKDLEHILRYDLPAELPSDPSKDPSSLVTLRSYSVHPHPPSSMDISGIADVINPLPESIKGAINYPLKFLVSLLPNSQDSGPAPAPIVTLTTDPIQITHPNVTLSLSGTLLSLPRESVPLLSAFISNFLSARPSPIRIQVPEPLSFSFDTMFPAPKEKPKIIKNVRMTDMKLYPDPETGEVLLAEGTIIAALGLPPGLEKIDLNIAHMLPDVLIYDGTPTSGGSSPSPLPPFLKSTSTITTSEHKEPFPAPPLPTPLPSNAFARIRPRYWLDAVSTIGPDPTEPTKNTTIVTARLKDVPLEILPKRDRVFRGFIQKVIFKGEAVAGIKGDAAVGVTIGGIPLGNNEEMELRNLPVEGQFTIHRGGVKKLKE